MSNEEIEALSPGDAKAFYDSLVMYRVPIPRWMDKAIRRRLPPDDKRRIEETKSPTEP